ncbi:hypothetical protein GJ496_000652 [Pomphorhynchus laevis]|nr:hypothetical protein GJ496_000652 [Pomphorhynchus laevis]
MPFHYLFIIFEIITSSFLFVETSDWWKISVCTVPRSSSRSNSTELELKCLYPGDLIVVSWSHYGVYADIPNKIQQRLTNNNAECTPKVNDCIMEHTEKVAELCTGQERCAISNQPQFVHKCSKYSNYIYIAYKCIPAESTEQICSSSNLIADDIFITSPNYPSDYKSSQKCICDLKTSQESSLIINSMAFATQEDNDIVTIENSNSDKLMFSGSLPIGTMLLFSGNYARIQFESDRDVSSSGFLISAKAMQRCSSGYDGVGELCLLKLSNTFNWFDGKVHCESSGDDILSWPEDISEARQLLNWMKFSDVAEVWLNSRSPYSKKSQLNWSSSIPTLKKGKCLIRGSKGFFTSSCQSNLTTICAHKREAKQYPISMQCNMKPLNSRNQINAESSINTKPFGISSNSHQFKRLSIIQGCLFWLLCTCIALVTVNLVICLTCYRRTMLLSFRDTSNDLPLWNCNYLKDLPTMRESVLNDQACCTYCSHCLTKRNTGVFQSQRPSVNHHVYEQILAAKCKSIANKHNNLDKDDHHGDLVEQKSCRCCCHHFRIVPIELLSSNASAESGYSSNNRVGG